MHKIFKLGIEQQIIQKQILLAAPILIVLTLIWEKSWRKTNKIKEVKTFRMWKNSLKPLTSPPSAARQLRLATHHWDAACTMLCHSKTQSILKLAANDFF